MSKPTREDVDQLKTQFDADFAEEQAAREALHSCLRGRGYFGIPSNAEEKAIWNAANAVYESARTKTSASSERFRDAYQRFSYGDENGDLPPEDVFAGDDQGQWPENGYRGEYRTFSGPQVAQQLGISDSRVYRLARRRGLGRQVGGVWMYTAADVAAMRDRPAGKAGQVLTAAYRRLNIFDTIINTLTEMVNTNRMSPVEYERAKATAQTAYLAQDEVALTHILEQYTHTGE